MARPRSENPLFEIAWQFRVNRFRGTWLGRLPMPLPEHYLLGFDEQKIETEGIPLRFSEAIMPHRAGSTRSGGRRRPIARRRRAIRSTSTASSGRPAGGATTCCALLYKIPEGTWLLVALSLVVLVATKRSPAGWFDELVLWTVPVVILVSMSLLTDINLGLRYVLAILPYVFISTGKVVPWCLGLREPVAAHRRDRSSPDRSP